MRSAPITRRTALKRAIGAAAGAALVPGLARLAPPPVADAAQDGPPEFILTNATIITMNPAQPAAQAAAIRGGRIVAVGSHEEAASWAGLGTHMRDLGGQVVIPGFYDSHNHMLAPG